MGNLVNQVNENYKNLISIAQTDLNAAKQAVTDSKAIVDGLTADLTSYKTKIASLSKSLTSMIDPKTGWAFDQAAYDKVTNQIGDLRKKRDSTTDQLNAATTSYNNNAINYNTLLDKFNALNTEFQNAVIVAQKQEDASLQSKAAVATTEAIASDPSLLKAQIDADAALKQKQVEAQAAIQSAAASAGGMADKNKNMIIAAVAIVVVIGLVFVAIKVLR